MRWHRLLYGLRAGRCLAESPPLADHLHREIWPGREVNSDAEMADAVRAQIGVYQHPVGTCRMGPASDANAVVDATGHVRGTRGLQVVDASIMPIIPRANTNLPTLMVAEQIGAMFT